MKATKTLVLGVKENIVLELGEGFTILTFENHKMLTVEGSCLRSEENAIPSIISQTWLSQGSFDPKKQKWESEPSTQPGPTRLESPGDNYWVDGFVPRAFHRH